MLGYSKYWTAGFTAYQWWGLFHKVNVTEFDFINIGVERDRVMNSYGFWFHLLGLRFWLCVAWESPSQTFMDALNEVVKGD